MASLEFTSEHNKKRFWLMVDKGDESGCWLWTGPKDPKSGYGYFNYGSASHKYAHRVSFEYTYGEQDRRLRIAQTCNNPLCVNPSHMEDQTVEKRFWSNVKKGKKDDCWEWTGYRDPNGYGRLSVKDYPKLTHRISYEIEYGSISDELNILHRCDNPPCVNPNHLIPGTQADNIHDMVTKGRQNFGHTPRGENNHNATMKNHEVIEMRRLYKSGVKPKKLEELFPHASRGVIEDIIYNNTWLSLLEEETAV